VTTISTTTTVHEKTTGEHRGEAKLKIKTFFPSSSSELIFARIKKH